MSNIDKQQIRAEDVEPGDVVITSHGKRYTVKSFWMEDDTVTLFGTDGSETEYDYDEMLDVERGMIMSTITRGFTKEQLQQIEAAAKEVLWPVVWSDKKAREHFSEKITPKVVLKLARIALASLEEGAELQRKAAIHDLLCKKYNVESLADFVDWQRNHIAELEIAPPAPVGEGDAAVMPDYPGYVMTQRECFQAGKKAGQAENGNSPVIPDGFVMVPIEATLDMVKDGAVAASTGMLIPGIYKAMVAAAPQHEVKP
ncbi:hypothetical protein [Enterobacter sp. T2]|uniref:hypothetical protein n=1 Tax=Enterobacter sp. T2 TaxID=2707174 RepID=UPI00256EFAAC|nr:hypothetical protein [Enterobacter sp. T2]